MVTDGEREDLIPPGTVLLDKYRVIRTLGVGGMGVVVLADHTTLGTPVAIKFLSPQFAAVSTAARRFVQEAKAASRISSEHIVRVFDAGTIEQFGPYIIMEYLEGRDLGRELRERGGLPIEEVVDYGAQAALALAEAHNAGVVHRDVKPTNLYVVQRSDGSAWLKVLDFGISKVVEQAPLHTTSTGAILGSALYMSPEQMRSAKNVDHRTDVYALGVSMYELLAGVHPYEAESFSELVMKVNLEPPADLLVRRPDVPADLAAALAKAYRTRPEDRYQTVAELASALVPWASPSTRHTIEAIVRVDARRRPSSLPSLPPPPASAPLVDRGTNSEQKDSIVAPLAQSATGSMHPWGRTHAETPTPQAERSTRSLLAVGVAVGVALSLATAALYMRRGHTNSSAASVSLADESLDASQAAARAEPTARAAASAVSAPPTAPSGSERAPKRAPASATPPGTAATPSSAGATASVGAPSASAAPTASSSGPGCYTQDADGSLRRCGE
ncbi:MAG: serine/threonine protein kinase [Polyangiaceae bacterium]|nr:serine/threonine protein kinase [Polyangiaceae bacterium]